MATVAVIRTGGKQYKVREGETLEIERLTAEPGSSTEFADVLLLAQDSKVQVGKPTVSGAKVVAEVVAHDRAPKVVAFKYRRREGYHRTVGHRQARTRIKIKTIQAGK
jgi:large subunit ribosomal protein L21